MFPVSWDFVWLPFFEPEITLCRLKSVCAKKFVCTKKKTFKMTKFQQFFRFFRGEENEFLGIFCNIPLGHIFRKLDAKFGWPMMTKTCSNRVSTALDFFDKLKFRSIVVTSQKQQFYGAYNIQTIFNRGKMQYDCNTMMHYKYIAVYRVSKLKLVWNLSPP